MTEGEKIIDNCIAGIENFYCSEFPKRAGFIASDGKRIDDLLAAERERCAKIVDNLTAVLKHEGGCPPEDICALHGALAEIAADTIRNGGNMEVADDRVL